MKTIKIKDLGRTVTGHTPPTSESKYYGDYMPFVKPTDIDKDSKFTYNPEQYYSIEAAEKYRTSLIPKGSTCVVCIGTIGEKMTMAHCDMYTNQSINSIIPSSSFDPDYVYYLLKYNLGKVKALNKGTASGREFVSKSTFLEMEVQIHEDLQTQRQIGRLLSAYDDLIELNLKQIALIEEATQRLFRQWFVDFRFPGYESRLFTNGLPLGWSTQKFVDVFSFVRGKSYTSQELSDSKGVLMANLKNIRAFGGYKRNEEKRFLGAFKENQTLSPGDVVMGVTDMTQERRLVGHVAIVPDLKEPMTFSMDLIKLLPKIVSRNYLYSVFFYGGLSKKVSPFANGVNVLHLKPDSMMGLEMVVPDDKTLQLYDSVFEPYRIEIEALQEQNQNAIAARDLLIPRLFSGEIII